MVNLTVYVDESGNAVLNKPEHIKKFPFFVIGFVVCQEPQLLRKKMRRLMIKLHKRRKYYRSIMELKFNPYSALKKQSCSKIEIRTRWEPHFDLVRKQANSLIANTVDGVFAGVLDKRTVGRNTWTSERIGNFLFSRSLYQNILPNVGDFDDLTVIYDRGRLDPKRTQSFNRYMQNTKFNLERNRTKRYAVNVTTFKDVNSLSDPGIWAADFVAGSFRHAYLTGDQTYVDILRHKFVGSGVRRLWFK